MSFMGKGKPPVDQHTESLYADRVRVYPKSVHGPVRRFKWAVLIFCLTLYYVLPWVRWNRGIGRSNQAVLLDIFHERFWFFNLEFWPQDIFYLTGLLIMGAVALFLVTSLFGRLWCGYACPQTVWTEIFVWMERLAEGSRSQQMKLDQGPWNARKIGRKFAKQALWLSFAGFTGMTFVGFFSPIDDLAVRLFAGTLTLTEGFWVIFYGLATYGNAGFMREQVCKYMCPYARFQSAMFDRNTLVISYDAARGEPRGARSRGTDSRSLGQGDCIDCTLCVQVCPTGIDIRKGLQYECIACAACIDACDAVMDKVGSPRGLVRYSTQAELDGAKAHIVRPRTIIYSVLLALLMWGFIYAVLHRMPVALDVLRDRNTLYRELDDGRIENVFSVRIINKDQRPHTFRLAASNLANATVDSDSPTQQVDAEDVKTVVVRVRVPPDQGHGGQDFLMTVQAVDRPQITASTRARFFSKP